MSDETEAIRRQQLAEINAQPGSREALEVEHGQVWDTQQLSQDFTVEGFLAPYVVVRRKSDGQRGQPPLPAQTQGSTSASSPTRSEPKEIANTSGSSSHEQRSQGHAQIRLEEVPQEPGTRG